MLRFVRFLLLTLSLALAWCYGVLGVDEVRAGPLREAFRQAPPPLATVSQAGQTQSLTVNGRRFLLHVPPGYQPQQPMPLVMALQAVARTWPLGPLTKFAAINLIAVSVLLISYHFLVRKTWLGLLLNGPNRFVSPAAVRVQSPS